MPILECSIAPPDEDEQTSKNDYPAIKYLVFAILFFIVSKFSSLRAGKKSRKRTGIPAENAYSCPNVERPVIYPHMRPEPFYRNYVAQGTDAWREEQRACHLDKEIRGP